MSEYTEISVEAEEQQRDFPDVRHMLPSPLTVYHALTAALAFLSPSKSPDGGEQAQASSLTFTLRHSHALNEQKGVVWSDIAPSSSLASSSFTLRSRTTKTHRPRSRDAFNAARASAQPQSVDWDADEVPGPDVTDRETLHLLAQMTSNAYYGSPNDKGWYYLGDKWNNNTYPVGWEPDTDGFRGQVFSTPDNSTVVLSIKGTSVAYIGGGPTVRKDKLNDNLLFSCCCAKVGPTWSPVCGCHAGGWKCDRDCVQTALVEDSLFYPVGTNLYNNLTYLYPHSNIWIIGHSLGGSLAALLGATFGTPVVAFEAPAEKRAAERLHLPLPPALSHITHVFHTADPIPMGTCTGVTSACATGGFAMETKCHLGRKILYDTVTKWKWGVSVRTHLIGVIVEKLLAVDWDSDDAPPEEPDPGNDTSTSTSFAYAPRTTSSWWLGRGRRGGGAVPEAVDEDPDCSETECYGWEYGDFFNSSKLSY